MMAGNVRSAEQGLSVGAEADEKPKPPSGIPTIADRESSQQPPDEKAGEQPPPRAAARRRG